MQLNVSTCYAMQIILYLTRNKRIVSSTEIAENLNISPRYTIQIAGKLRDGDMIMAHAGMSGGYSLNNRKPVVTVYDVLTLMEGDMSVTECAAPCENANLHDAMSILKDYMGAYLKSLTFEMLADQKSTGRITDVINMVEVHIGAMKEQNEK